MYQQQSDYVAVIMSSRLAERRLAVPVGRGYVGAMIEENFRCSTAAVGCRQYQWRSSKGSMEIHFGLEVKDPLNQKMVEWGTRGVKAS